MCDIGASTACRNPRRVSFGREVLLLQASDHAQKGHEMVRRGLVAMVDLAMPWATVKDRPDRLMESSLHVFCP